jgi:AraC-like DNA-binding protein
LRRPTTLDFIRPNPLRKLAADDRSVLASFIKAWTHRKDREGELEPWLRLVLERFQRAPTAVQGKKSSNQMAVLIAHESSLMDSINRQFLPRVHEIFGLKDLAARLNISESYLRARFRRETGISLGHHVKRLRHQKAMGLLALSDLSITQIAERCGFDTLFTFSRAFRRFSGLSAKEYRAQVKSRANKLE